MGCSTGRFRTGSAHRDLPGYLLVHQSGSPYRISHFVFLHGAARLGGAFGAGAEKLTGVVGECSGNCVNPVLPPASEKSNICR